MGHGTFAKPFLFPPPSLSTSLSQYSEHQKSTINGIILKIMTQLMRKYSRIWKYSLLEQFVLQLLHHHYYYPFRKYNHCRASFISIKHWMDLQTSHALRTTYGRFKNFSPKKEGFCATWEQTLLYSTLIGGGQWNSLLDHHEPFY